MASVIALQSARAGFPAGKLGGTAECCASPLCLICAGGGALFFCPGGCIRVNGTAHFDYTNCQGCLACAHACTQKAIALRIPEANPGARYRNEHVTLQDIIYANNQH